MIAAFVDLHPMVAEALRQGQPLVALESTLIAHGLPWPENLETAQQAEQAIRQAGAVPATIAVLRGRPTIGLHPDEMERLARGEGVLKASNRDLAAAIVKESDAATTVSATMRLAHHAGIRVFATGGIGGVHPVDFGRSLDVSADLVELGRTPVCVVCSGAKSILDLQATLEYLETQGVPVLGYQTDTFAAFYLRCSGLPVPVRVETPAEIAKLVKVHQSLGGGGVLVAQPLPEAFALEPQEFHRALVQAETEARRENISGPALTPYLLAQLRERTQGKTVRANQELILANASLAAQVACALTKETT